MKKNFIPLKTLLKITGDDTARRLFSFTCEKDIDIQNFLAEKAIEFEEAGKSRTFIIFDEEDDDLKILAYYTLALQIFSIPNEFLNRKIVKFDGLFAKKNGEKIQHLPVILIGQLGKNDQYKDCITGEEIMQFCLSTILDGQKRLSGRLIMLECKDIPYLIALYERFGFERIDKEYGEDELLQFVRILDATELM